MSGPDRRVARALLRLWNLAWDAALIGALAAVMFVADRLFLHRGDRWVLAAVAVAFVGSEVGLRIGWWLVRLFLEGRARS